MRRRALALRVVAACLVAAGVAPAAQAGDGATLDDLIRSTWRVEHPDGSIGSAFLIHRDGDHAYFVTAAHVVRRARPGEGQPRWVPEVDLVGPDEPPQRLAAEIVGFWCEAFDERYGVCRLGDDAALLRVTGLPAEFVPFELGFAAAQPFSFHGFFSGHSREAVGALPSPEVSFGTVNVARHAEYGKFFEPGSTLFYQTGAETFAGNSGGPIVVRDRRGFEVVGILAWRRPSHPAEDAASPSFGTTIDVLRRVWGALPASPPVAELARSVADRSISSEGLSRRLARMSNGEVVSFVDDLRTAAEADGGAPTIGRAYWNVVYDAATVRDLDLEKLYLETRTPIEHNASWLRDSAKSRRRIAQSLLIDPAADAGSKAEAAVHLTEAVDLNQRFLGAAQTLGEPWYGPRVFGDVAWEMATIHDWLDNPEEATAWTAASSSLGVPTATSLLASRAFERGEYEDAAHLYKIASSQSREAGAPVPAYVRTSYSDSLAALVRTGRGSPGELPATLEAVDPTAANDRLSVLEWVSERWRTIVQTFGPESAVAAAERR